MNSRSKILSRQHNEISVRRDTNKEITQLKDKMMQNKNSVRTIEYIEQT